MSSKRLPILIHDTTHSNPDLLYFGRVAVPDAFTACLVRGRKHAVVSALEFNRVRKESDFDVVLPLEEFIAQAKARWPRRPPGPAEVITLLAARLRQRSFLVPGSFPAFLYERVRALGVKLRVASTPLFPEREIKSAAEAAAIREGNRCSARGIAAAERILRASRIRGRRLVHQGRTLTSERLRFAIETACLEAGAISLETIVAGGDQGCDPHELGHGPLRPNELIVIDVFPRVTATGYHGDMTRTFLRGRASDAQRRLVAAVHTARREAFKRIRSGVNGRDVHEHVSAILSARGFQTERKRGVWVGFFHGTGHGLGLAVHEPPRISTQNCILRKGTVVTVEPGLYYPGLGGCRIEDVVQVTAGSPRLLSRYHYRWEIS